MNQMSMKRAVAPAPSLILEENLDTLHFNSSTTTALPLSFIVFPCNYFLSTGTKGSLCLESMLLILVCNPVLLFPSISNALHHHANAKAMLLLAS